MKETAHKFGASVPIIGILTEPSDERLIDASPTILLVNAGLLGRAGPFRLHVILARELAKIGFRTMRIDLSGIGDSGRHKDNRPREEQHLNDIRDAMQYLEDECSVKQFIVMGICTGADNSHRALRKDKRVIGAVCVDGYSYPTFRYYFNYYAPKLVNLTSWKNIFKRLARRLSGAGQDGKEKEDENELDYRWQLPPKEETRADYQEFIDRDARLLCVYTAGWRCNYSGQLAEAFSELDFGKAISAIYLPNATHTFKVEEDRNELIAAVKPWLEANWNTK